MADLKDASEYDDSEIDEKYLDDYDVDLGGEAEGEEEAE